MEYNEKLIKDFIEQQKTLWKSKISIKRAYKVALDSWQFDIKETPKPNTFVDSMARSIKPLWEVFTKTIPQMWKDIFSWLQSLADDTRTWLTWSNYPAQWIVWKTKNIFTDMQTDIKQVKEFEVQWEQWALSSQLQATWFAWGAFINTAEEIFMSGLKTIATDDQEKFAKEQLVKLSKTETWEDIMQFYQKKLWEYEMLKKINPAEALKQKSIMKGLETAFEIIPWVTTLKVWENIVDAWKNIWDKVVQTWKNLWTTVKDLAWQWVQYWKERLWAFDMSSTSTRKVGWIWKIKWAIDAWTEKIAWKVLWSTSWKKELFQAASPSYQTLWNDKNISNIWQNFEKADETVLKYWYTPTDTETRASAFKGSMKKVWTEVENARGAAIEKTDGSQFADLIDIEIKDRINRWEFLPSDESDITALTKLAEYYRWLEAIDIPTLWWMRARLNAEISFKMWSDFWDMYNAVLKKVWIAIRQTENNIIWSVKWTQFKELMLEYKALAETYPDIIKANIKNMRKKWSSLEESFSRISWIGDIIAWAWKVFTKWSSWFADIGKWLWKVAVWKVLWKLKDTDFLVKEWYRKLSATTPKVIKKKPTTKPKVTDTKKPTVIKKEVKKVEEKKPTTKTTIKKPETKKTEPKSETTQSTTKTTIKKPEAKKEEVKKPTHQEKIVAEDKADVKKAEAIVNKRREEAKKPVVIKTVTKSNLEEAIEEATKIKAAIKEIVDWMAKVSDEMVQLENAKTLIPQINWQLWLKLNPKVKEDFDYITKILDIVKRERLESAPKVIKPTESTIKGTTFYHWTRDDFSEFNLKKVWENTQFDNASFWIFFSDNKSAVQDFLKTTKVAGETRKDIIKEVQLDIKNPIDLTIQWIFTNKKQAPLLVDMLWWGKMSSDDALAYIDDNIWMWEIGELYETIYSNIWNKAKMQEAWFDWMIAQFWKDAKWAVIKEYIAFEPSQINIINNTPKVIKPKTIDKPTWKDDNTPKDLTSKPKSNEKSNTTITNKERWNSTNDKPVSSWPRGTSSTTKEMTKSPEEIEINKKLDKKSRKVINQESSDILHAHSFSTKAEDYTLQEIETLKRYSWVGWLNEATDTPVWALTEFYTPKTIVDKLWGLAWKYGIRWGKAFEPSTWIGWIINRAPAWFKTSWIELSRTSWTIAQILNPKADIKVGDFYDMFMNTNYYNRSKKVYDWEKKNLIIGNPPYFKRQGRDSLVDSHLWESQDYFVSKWLDMLEDNWLLVYVVNNWFLAKKWVANLKSKKDIASKWTLVDAYRLPSWLFTKEWTWISTEILVIRKKPWNVNDFIEDNFFKENADKLLYDEIKWEWQFKKYIWDESQLDNIDIETRQKETTFKPLKEVAKKTDVKVTDTTKPHNKKQVIVNKDTSKIDWTEVHSTLMVKGKDITTDTQDLLDKTWFNLEVVGKTDIKAWEPVNYDPDGIIYDDFYFSGDIYKKLDILENNKQHIIDNFWEAQYKKQKEWLEKIKPTVKKLDNIELSYKNNVLMGIEWEDWKNLLSIFKDWIRDKEVQFWYWISRYDVMTELNWWRLTLTKLQRERLPSQIDQNINLFKFDVPKELRSKIEDIYNKKLNSFVDTDYSKLPFINKNIAKKFRWTPFNFTEVQSDWIKRLIYKGSWLIAYWVWVWKTHTLLWATKWLLDSWRVKKPLFIVPKSTITKTWIDTMKKMYPWQKVVNLWWLTAPDIRRLKKEHWNDSKDWIQDWDMAIITHEGINILWMDMENIKKVENTLSDVLTVKSGQQKMIEKEDLAIEEIIAKSMWKANPDITIEWLWIDHLSVDEVHNFRKVFQWAQTLDDADWISTNRFSKVMWWTPSKRAQKLFLLSQYIQSKNDWRWVFLASATPFENQATEVYNIISLIWYQRLKELGIKNINDFYWNFANYHPELVKKPSWAIETTEVFEDFYNKPELQKIIREFIDYREDPYLVRPDKKVRTPYLEQSSQQVEVSAKIIELAKSKEDWAILKASTYWKINSTSPYFIWEYYPNPDSISPTTLVDWSPKLKFTFDTIKRLKEQPNLKGKWHFVYFWDVWAKYLDHYKRYFTEKWVYKDSEIWVIWGSTSAEARELIKEKFNDWRIKLLIWGKPTTEWIDLQGNWVSTHILWLWWNPTQMTQVEWRIWRQWNNSSQVLVSYPLVENSNDLIMFQKFKEKWWRIASLFDYNAPDVKDTKVDYKEQMIALMTDPKDKVAIKMDIETTRLQWEKTIQVSLIKDLERSAITIKSSTRAVNDSKDSLVRYESTLEDQKIMYKGYKENNNTEKLEYLERQIEGTKDSIKRIKDNIKKSEFSIDNNKKLLEWFWVKDVDKLDEKIAEIKIELERIEKNIELLPEKSSKMFEEFVEEKRLHDKKKKSYEDNIKDMTWDLSDIKYYSQEELDNIKIKLKQKKAD